MDSPFNFNGMFGHLESGMCRLGVNGDIAVKTKSGYKTYNVDTGKLVNCSNFVFPIGSEFFFVIPTNKVTKGDIILVGGRPKCVIEASKDKITAVDYESSEIKTIIPERHIFMGSTYFYGKIVSMFGGTGFLKGKKGISKMMQFMMMNEMMKGMNGNTNALANTNGQNNGMMAMMPFMMMGGANFGDMFEGIFDFGFDTEDTDDNDSEEVAAEVVGIADEDC